MLTVATRAPTVDLLVAAGLRWLRANDVMPPRWYAPDHWEDHGGEILPGAILYAKFRGFALRRMLAEDFNLDGEAFRDLLHRYGTFVGDVQPTDTWMAVYPEIPEPRKRKRW